MSWEPGEIRYNERKSNSLIGYSVGSGNGCTTLRVRGSAKFSPDETDVVALTDSSAVALGESTVLLDRIVDYYRSPNGTITRVYHVNGVEKPFDTAAQQWFAKLLPDLLIKARVNIAERIALWRQQGGIHHVLEKISGFPTTEIQRAHYDEVLRQKLTIAELDTMLLQGSFTLQTNSSDLRAFITTAIGLWPNAFANSRNLPSLEAAIARVPLSTDRAAILELLGDNADRDRLLLIINRAKTVNSGDDESRVLMRFANQFHAGTNFELITAFYATVASMPTNSEKRNVLIFAIPFALKSAMASELLLNAIDKIDSSSDRAAVLLSFVESNGLRNVNLEETFLKIATKISSAADRATLARRIGR